MNNREGFTIPELLAVIAILGILVTVAIGSYNSISKSVKEKTYENKIKLIETKAYEFASDNEIDNATISVARLINDGYLDAENATDDSEEISNERINNPLGGYLDCYNIVINKDVDNYVVKVNATSDCSLADNDNLNASTKIYAYTDKEAIVADSNYSLPGENSNILYQALGSNQDTTWTNASNVYLYLDLNNFKEEIGESNKVKVTWDYNGVTTSKENIATYEVTNDETYPNIFKISTSLLLHTNVSATITIGELNITQKANVKIDREKPTLKYSLSEQYAKGGAQKDLRLVGDDMNGSGVVSYALEEQESTNPNFTISQDDSTTKVSHNGTYYAYAKDAVGNISGPTTVEVKIFDTDTPTCKVPVSQNANTWSRSYTYSYGCNNDNTTGCKTEDKFETITRDTVSKSIEWDIEDNVDNKFHCSSDVRVNVDTTAPTCSIEIAGTKGKNNWYTSKKVTLKLNVNDNFKDYGSIDSYGISTSSTPVYNNLGKLDLTSDTDGTTYYGYVKDKAGNTGTCQVTVKILSETPSCNINVTGGRNGTEWYVSDVKTSINSSSRHVSSKIITNNNQANYTINYNTTGVKVTGRVENEAGTSNTCSTTIKRDADAPEIDFTFKKTRDNYSCDTYEKGCNDVESNIKIKKSVSGVKSTGVSNHSSSHYVGDWSEINACVAKYTGGDTTNILASIIYQPLCLMQTFGDKTKWEYTYYSSPHTFVQETGATELYYAKVCSNANVCKEVVAEISTPEPQQTNDNCSVLGGAAIGAAGGWGLGCTFLGAALGPAGLLVGLVGGAIAGGIACAMS